MSRARVTLALALLAMVVAGRPRAQEASSGWKAAEPGREFRFPADHASHPEYRIEWWYYTGQLAAADGRRFGYQLTFFRFGVQLAPANPSRWAVRDIHMAHAAITDLGARRHVAAEKLSRSGVGWAGADTSTYRVWNEQWSAKLDAQGRHVLSAASPSPAFSLDLVLDQGKPPVLQGDSGFSQKGASPGNASHYYSLTRMPTRGVLTLNHTRVDVAGDSWMDHEFGTSFLEPGQVGWDWFALQLDDRTELMLYGMRVEGGGFDPRSSGTMVAPDGSATPLRMPAFALRPGRTWTSPLSRGRYPVEWRLTVPAHGLDLHVRAAVDAQEMGAGLASGLAYWEGAVSLSGTKQGKGITGRGYLEMTGYAGRPMGQFLAGP